jgi:hypothetical protein
MYPLLVEIGRILRMLSCAYLRRDLLKHLSERKIQVFRTNWKEKCKSYLILHL